MCFYSWDISHSANPEIALTVLNCAMTRRTGPDSSWPMLTRVNPSWPQMIQNDPSWLKMTQVDPKWSKNYPSWPKLTQVDRIQIAYKLHPERIQITSRPHPDCIQTRPIQPKQCNSLSATGAKADVSPTFGAQLSHLRLYYFLLPNFTSFCNSSWPCQ